MLKIKKNLLLKALDITALSVAKIRSIEPLVKITAIGKTLTFLTTDGDFTTFYKVNDVNIIKEFEVCVPHKEFKAFVSKLPDSEVIIRLVRQKERGDAFLYIQSNHTKTLIDTRSADVFPFKGIEKTADKTITIKADVLLSMINKVSTAMCTDEARFYICGILLNLNNKSVSCIATDSHRLSLTTTGLESDIEKTKIILPRKSINAVKTFLNNHSGLDINLNITTKPSKAIFSYEGYAISTSLIDGEFPEYERVIPKNTQMDVVCNAKDLINAVNQVSISDDIKFVELEITSNKINIVAQPANTNPIHIKAKALKTKTQINCVANQDINVKYNASYLIDAINACGTEDIKLSFTEASKPVKILPINKADTAVVEGCFIVMPIRI